MSEEYKNSEELFRDYAHRLNNSLSVLVASFDLLQDQVSENPKAFPENFTKMLDRMMRATDKLGVTAQELRSLFDKYEITPKS